MQGDTTHGVGVTVVRHCDSLAGQKHCLLRVRLPYKQIGKAVIESSDRFTTYDESDLGFWDRLGFCRVVDRIPYQVGDVTRVKFLSPDATFDGYAVCTKQHEFEWSDKDQLMETAEFCVVAWTPETEDRSRITF